jgi:hypothetical protein
MLQVPLGQVADVGTMPAGTVSVTTAPTAFEGPELRTLSWYDTALPATTGSGVPILVRLRSAAEVRLPVALEELLPDTGSALVVVTDAVLIDVPEVAAALTLPVMVTVTTAPGASVPMSHVTVPPRMQPEPVMAVAVTAVAVIPVGIGSLSATPVAVDGPLLVTSTV